MTQATFTFDTPRNTSLPHFDGADVTHDDQPRLGAQLERILSIISDGQWRTLSLISEQAQAPEASVSAQLRNLRKARFGGHNVERRHMGGGLFEYRLNPF